jgi:hypothetical protein
MSPIKGFLFIETELSIIDPSLSIISKLNVTSSKRWTPLPDPVIDVSSGLKT